MSLFNLLADRLLAAGNAMADEMDLIAADTVEASGDPTDGDHLRSLVQRWRTACAPLTEEEEQ
jgi:hypothetical protein